MTSRWRRSRLAEPAGTLDGAGLSLRQGVDIYSAIEAGDVTRAYLAVLRPSPGPA